MNKYQKIVNQLTKYAKIQYDSIFANEDYSFRWHRCQARLIVKLDKENNIKDMLVSKNSYLKQCKKDGLI